MQATQNGSREPQQQHHSSPTNALPGPRRPAITRRGGMHTPHVPAYPKDVHYRIQDPVTELYARIEDLPPATPQPAEESTGAVAWRSAHITFEQKPRATWFTTHRDALAAFARYIRVAPLEIVRCEP